MDANTYHVHWCTVKCSKQASINLKDLCNSDFFFHYGVFWIWWIFIQEICLKKSYTFFSKKLCIKVEEVLNVLFSDFYSWKKEKFLTSVSCEKQDFFLRNLPKISFCTSTKTPHAKQALYFLVLGHSAPKYLSNEGNNKRA